MRRTALVVALLAALCVHAAAQSPARLVVSIPEEVSLDAPGMTRAAEAWVEMIRGARRSIDVAQFYVASEPGKELEPVLDALESAGRRGIAIRFLLSSAMVNGDTITLDRLRNIPGLELRIFDLKRRTGGVLHAKYWIVDGETILVGSQNFDWRSLSQIQELGVQIRDTVLAERLDYLFACDWALAAMDWDAPEEPVVSAEVARSGDVELVASPARLNPPGIRAAAPALVQLIGEAKSSIDVQILTYSPVTDTTRYWPVIDSALRAAAVHGVKVRLMVSVWNTAAPSVNHLKSLALLPNVAIRIVTFPPHSSGPIPFARVIHSKYMVVDGETLWVGTSNWSRDYFEQMRNVELIIGRPALANEAAALYESLWSSPYAEPIDINKTYPTPKRG